MLISNGMIAEEAGPTLRAHGDGGRILTTKTDQIVAERNLFDVRKVDIVETIDITAVFVCR
jgi:hypothetical protein